MAVDRNDQNLQSSRAGAKKVNAKSVLYFLEKRECQLPNRLRLPQRNTNWCVRTVIAGSSGSRINYNCPLECAGTSLAKDIQALWNSTNILHSWMYWNLSTGYRCAFTLHSIVVTMCTTYFVINNFTRFMHCVFVFVETLRTSKFWDLRFLDIQGIAF